MKKFLVAIIILSFVSLLQNKVNADYLSGLSEYHTKFSEGSFSISVSYLAEDVSGDGKDDLIMYNNDGSLKIYFNGNIPLGAYSYATESTFNVKYTGLDGYGNTPSSIIAKDVNNDGKNDLTIVNGDYTKIYIILSTQIDDFVNTTNNVIDLPTTPSAYFLRILAKTGYLWRSDIDHIISFADSNGDGKKDMFISNSSSDDATFYIDSSIFINLPLGSTLDLNSPSSYTAQFNHNNSSSSGGYGTGYRLGDITGDGKEDLVLYENDSTYGSMNIIFGSKLATITGTGNQINILTDANLNNVSVKYKGFLTGQISHQPTYNAIKIGNIVGDNFKDLVFGSNWSGQSYIYVISSEKIRTLEGTSGNVLELSDQASYSFVFQNAGTSGYFGAENTVYINDVTGDGVNELLLGDTYNNYACTDCGSLYVISSSLLSSFNTLSSPNKILPLTTASNYFLRIKGGLANMALGDNWGYGGSIAIDDVNNDGYSDITLGSIEKKKIFQVSGKEIANLGNTTENEWSMVGDWSTGVLRMLNNITPRNSKPVIGDINGDGKNDFMQGDYTTGLYIYLGASSTLTESSNTTVVKESELTDTLDLKLNTMPFQNVVVTLTPSDSQIIVNPSTLTFTSGDYNTPQQVTITANEDLTYQGTRNVTINYSVASDDSMYNSLTIASTTVEIQDNEVPPVTTTPTPTNKVTKTVVTQTQVTAEEEVTEETEVVEEEPTPTLEVTIEEKGGDELLVKLQSYSDVSKYQCKVIITDLDLKELFTKEVDCKDKTKIENTKLSMLTKSTEYLFKLEVKEISTGKKILESSKKFIFNNQSVVLEPEVVDEKGKSIYLLCLIPIILILLVIAYLKYREEKRKREERKTN